MSTRLKNDALEQARADAAEAKAVERGLANVPALTPRYEQAEKATEPIDRSSPDPPPASVTRPITYANTLDDDPTPASVPNRANPQASGRGSEMVKKDQPFPEPSNKTPEGHAAKSNEFNKAWEAEYTRAKGAMEQARADAAEAKAAEAEAAQERSDERGMGMG